MMSEQAAAEEEEERAEQQQAAGGGGGCLLGVSPGAQTPPGPSPGDRIQRKISKGKRRGKVYSHTPLPCYAGSADPAATNPHHKDGPADLGKGKDWTAEAIWSHVSTINAVFKERGLRGRAFR